MTEIGKKLPLPAGSATNKHSKKIAILLAAAILLGTVIAACLFLTVDRTITSTRAFFSGSPLEIKVNIDGRLVYTAPPGQPVAAGEAVIKMDTGQYEQAAKEAEAVINARAGSIPQRSRSLMLRYLSIPQSEAELAEFVKSAQVTEKNFKDAYSEVIERQALFSLELRRLELKHNRLPEEEDHMDAMRIEEGLLRKSIKESYEEYETASLARATLERQLQNKRDLGKALRALPGTQREQLYALETEFYRMYEAEKQITLATVETPKNGKVMYTALSSGDTAKAGDTALYILPDDENSIWVTAYFTSATSSRIELGQPCTITFGDAEPVTLPGVVNERLPYLGDDGAGDLAFKITLKKLNADSLSGVNPKQAVQVTLAN